MSLINGEKSRSAVARRRRTAQRASDRVKREAFFVAAAERAAHPKPLIVKAAKVVAKAAHVVASSVGLTDKPAVKAEPRVKPLREETVEKAPREKKEAAAKPVKPKAAPKEAAGSEGSAPKKRKAKQVAE